MIKNKNELTLGSLFDGSGGFPLAGILAGVTPLWASEIEPFQTTVYHIISLIRCRMRNAGNTLPVQPAEFTKKQLCRRVIYCCRFNLCAIKAKTDLLLAKSNDSIPSSACVFRQTFVPKCIRLRHPLIKRILLVTAKPQVFPAVSFALHIQ